MMKKSEIAMRFLLAAALTVLCALPLFAQTTDSPSDNERLTTAAFDALKAGDFEAAIKKAGECIKDFRREAADVEKMLKDSKSTAPRVGPPKNDEEKQEVFSRGTLNDVAACYFIQGEAHRKLADRATGKEKMDRLQNAKLAYETAAKFTYARVWDTRGYFWDPAKTANNRIAEYLDPTRSP